MRNPKFLVEQRKFNRLTMPTVAAIVDEYRAFFPDLKVIFASEDGVRVGMPPANEKAFTIPRNYRKPAGGWK